MPKRIGFFLSAILGSLLGIAKISGIIIFLPWFWVIFVGLFLGWLAIVTTVVVTQ